MLSVAQLKSRVPGMAMKLATKGHIVLRTVASALVAAPSAAPTDDAAFSSAALAPPEPPAATEEEANAGGGGGGAGRGVALFTSSTESCFFR